MIQGKLMDSISSINPISQSMILKICKSLLVLKRHFFFRSTWGLDKICLFLNPLNDFVIKFPKFRFLTPVQALNMTA